MAYEKCRIPFELWNLNLHQFKHFGFCSILYCLDFKWYRNIDVNLTFVLFLLFVMLILDHMLSFIAIVYSSFCCFPIQNISMYIRIMKSIMLHVNILSFIILNFTRKHVKCCLLLWTAICRIVKVFVNVDVYRMFSFE